MEERLHECRVLHIIKALVVHPYDVLVIDQKTGFARHPREDDPPNYPRVIAMPARVGEPLYLVDLPASPTAANQSATSVMPLT